MAETVISCRELRHSYGEKTVLDGLSFSVPSGSIFGLLGKNGAGKTTTINILMGFLRPMSGECRVLGEPSNDIAPLTRRDIGLLHERFIQYDFMSIAEIERFHAAFYPKWERDVFRDLVGRLDVPQDRRISRMSCGQRSQVVLGLIMAQNPRLMLLDDYSMGLDVGYRRLFLDFLQEYVRERGTTVLVTSHVVQDLDRLIDEMVIIQNGKTLVTGRKDDFLRAFHRFTLPRSDATDRLRPEGALANVEHSRRTTTLHAFMPLAETTAHLAALGVETTGMVEQPMDFEDAFIGITGKY
ncbi:ABC-2 type transport system ATP-binding protein [Desulfobaculum xiamenense]|uniref:ABC-2 type transport system ATP-binding protein n=1 Tax=Desulfobaculum xiamenense TaxID=995050 RepID=A0A846QPN4_9BACT|nr:ABC transporter ATP-binding protein [Desulfobaculum xiamenense]NJB66669.1 ABC-2 type transport system ATP-binding protein [Desulfobaculum xiamenense]